MKKGSPSTTLVVLALEIASIAVLHAVKIRHSEKIAGSREVTHTISAGQTEIPPDSKQGSMYSLAVFH